ncbi:hypothetical protein ACTSKR_02370 [Chitinibacteraceae bacterium HSL-7]
MMIARWTVDVRFGHKAEAVALMLQHIGSQIGWTAAKTWMLLNQPSGVPWRVGAHRTKENELDAPWLSVPTPICQGKMLTRRERRAHARRYPHMHHPKAHPPQLGGKL